MQEMDERGAITTYGYDPLGRPVLKRDALGRDGVEYDAMGGARASWLRMELPGEPSTTGPAE